jgi:hypothetical protein
MAGGNTSTGADHNTRIMRAVTDVLHVPIVATDYASAYGGRKKGMLIDWQAKRYLLIGVWQGVGGTVDEKFPFLLAGAKGNRDYDFVVVILGGGGARRAAVAWAVNDAAEWNALGRRPTVVVLESAEDFRGACQRAAAHKSDLF